MAPITTKSTKAAARSTKSTKPTSTTTSSSTSSATPLLNLPAHDKSQLLDVYALLDTLFTRNRNQHRRSIWWKSLLQFRKQLALLINEAEGGTGGKGRRERERAARVEARLAYWRGEGVVGVWYWYVNLFSSLILLLFCLFRGGGKKPLSPRGIFGFRHFWGRRS